MKKLLNQIVCGVALLPAIAFSQELELKLVGDIYNHAPFWVADEDKPILAEAASVTAVFLLDDTVPQSGDPFRNYFDAILSVSFEFYDADGEPIDLGQPELYQPPENEQMNAMNYAVFDTEENYAYNSLMYTENETQYHAYASFSSDGVESIYASTDGFPRLVEVTQQANAYLSTFILDWEIGRVHFYTNLHTLEYRRIIQDDDGDEVADEDDQCVASILTENVMLNEMDSGVTNAVDANGCSIMDHYAACEAEQSNGAGWLGYQGASYCETQVGYTLYQQGLISYMELRMLRNALR